MKHCALPPQEFEANSFESRPDELAALWQDAEESVQWILQKYGAPGTGEVLPSGGGVTSGRS